MRWRRKPDLTHFRRAEVEVTLAAVQPETTLRLQAAGVCPIQPDDPSFPGTVAVLALRLCPPDSDDEYEVHISLDANHGLALISQMVLALQSHLTPDALAQGLHAAFQAINDALKRDG